MSPVPLWGLPRRGSHGPGTQSVVSRLHHHPPLRGGGMTTMTTTAPAANTVTRALTALVRVTDPARAARAATVEVESVKLSLNGTTLVGVTARTGEGGKYSTRITLAPRRGFNCSCPDATQRRVACKHVSALAARLAGMV